jgi:hypothetical protein
LSLYVGAPSAFDSAAAAVQPPSAQRVDGSNLVRVDFAGGSFEQRRGRWAEYGPDGNARHYFEETGRDEWSVYLLDRSRNVAIQLDVHRRMVTFAENGGRRSDLYPITEVTASWQRDNRRDRAGGARPDTGQADHSSAYAAIGGFYHQLDRPEVMFQFDALLHCHVQNPSQMNAFGGFSRVRNVPRLALRGTSAGECSWPNGFFRRTNEQTVYRLHGSGAMRLGRFACYVTDPRQMALYGGFGQVAVVEQNSDLFHLREQPEACVDP